MQKNLDNNSYEKRIENIEKGKSYLKSNGFFRSKSNLFEDIQKFIYNQLVEIPLVSMITLFSNPNLNNSHK